MQPENSSSIPKVRMRRRWGLAFFLSLIFGCSAAAAVFLLFPPHFVAESVIYIKATPTEILAAERDPQDFETYKKTQMFRSIGRMVLMTALKESVENQELKKEGYLTVGELPLIKSKPFPEDWMESKLSVEDRNKEFFSIVMTHNDHPHQMAEIVNAVTRVYMRDVANEDTKLKRDQIKLLDEAFVRLNKQIQLTENNITKYKKRLGGNRADSITALELANLELIQQLTEERNRLWINIMKLETLQADELDAAAVAALTEDIKPLLNSGQDEDLALLGSEATISPKKRVEIMKRVLAKMDALLAKQRVRPDDLEAESFELSRLEAELKKFQETAENLEQRTLQLMIELDAPDRIMLEHKAESPRLRDTAPHYKKCTSAGVGTAILSFFGIALIAPRRRRQESPPQT